MFDFAYHHLGNWRRGSYPTEKPLFVVVSYDMKNSAYSIPQHTISEFYEWVACRWELDNSPMEFDESAQDYLERIGVRVHIDPSQERLLAM